MSKYNAHRFYAGSTAFYVEQFREDVEAQGGSTEDMSDSEVEAYMMSYGGDEVNHAIEVLLQKQGVI